MIVVSDTTAIHSDTTIIASDLLLVQLGAPVGKAVVIADNAVPNNSQAAGGLVATATGGACWVEEVVVEKDSTAFAGPTNLELSSDNTYGPTGAADLHASNIITALGGNGRVKMSAGGVVAKLPFVLGSGKKLYVHGDDAAGTSAGNLQVTVIGRALAAGAYLL